MQRHLYEHFDLQGHLGFLNDVSVKLIDKTDPEDPTKREDYWIHPLKSKHHWYLMLKVVFRRNSLYFASLIKVMDRLYFGQWFSDRMSKFLLFLLLFLLFVGVFVVVSGFVILFYLLLLYSPLIFSYSFWLC